MVNRSLLLLIFFASTAVSAQELKWYGDLRIRAQREKELDREVHNNLRLRARFGVKVQLQDDLRVEIRLATAKSNRSSNQSLGDSEEPGFRRRFIGLDVGYVEWKPAAFAALYAGRFSQIHYRPGDTQLILDDDLALEGVSAKGDYEFLPDWKIFASAGSAFIRENYDNYYSQDLSDNMLNFAQLGINYKPGSLEMNLGAGFFNFTSVQGKNFADIAVGGKANGNSEAAAGVIRNPYLPKHFFLDAKYAFTSLNIGIFGEYIENAETSDPNHAWWTGINVGQSQWDLQAGVTQVDRDALMAMFTHSDFGNGKTDVRGYIGSVRWKFAKNMSVKLVQFYGWNNMSSAPVEYDRTHLDLNATF